MACHDVGWQLVTMQLNALRRVKGQINEESLSLIALARATPDWPRSHEYAKFRIFQIGPLLAEIRPIL